MFRIMLYRDSSSIRMIEYRGLDRSGHNDDEKENVNDEKQSKRYMSLEFSPLLPKSFCNFEITVEGIKGF